MPKSWWASPSTETVPLRENETLLSLRSTAVPWQSLQHTPEVVVEERARPAQLQVELWNTLVTVGFVTTGLHSNASFGGYVPRSALLCLRHALLCLQLDFRTRGQTTRARADHWTCLWDFLCRCRMHWKAQHRTIGAVRPSHFHFAWNHFIFNCQEALRVFPFQLLA